MVQQKKKKKSPQKTKHQEGLLRNLTYNKSVPSLSKGPNYASAYPIDNEKMFLHRSGSSFRLQRTVIWFTTQLCEFRSKQAKRANIHFLYINGQSLLIWLEGLWFANSTHQQHIARTKNSQKTRYEWAIRKTRYITRYSICRLAQMAPEAIWPGVFVYFKWIVNKCRSPWTKRCKLRREARPITAPLGLRSLSAKLQFLGGTRHVSAAVKEGRQMARCIRKTP